MTLALDDTMNLLAPQGILGGLQVPPTPPASPPIITAASINNGVLDVIVADASHVRWFVDKNVTTPASSTAWDSRSDAVLDKGLEPVDEGPNPLSLTIENTEAGTAYLHIRAEEGSVIGNALSLEILVTDDTEFDRFAYIEPVISDVAAAAPVSIFRNMASVPSGSRVIFLTGTNDVNAITPVLNPGTGEMAFGPRTDQNGQPVGRLMQHYRLLTTEALSANTEIRLNSFVGSGREFVFPFAMTPEFSATFGHNTAGNGLTGPGTRTTTVSQFAGSYCNVFMIAGPGIVDANSIVIDSMPANMRLYASTFTAEGGALVWIDPNPPTTGSYPVTWTKTDSGAAGSLLVRFRT